MLQAGAVFAGGVALRDQIGKVAVPTVRQGGVVTHKVTVRVVAASAPALDLPGVVSWHRPFLQLTLGSETKETEFADYQGMEPKVDRGKCAEECPWRFSDSITFRAKVEDLMGTGLKLKMFTRRDVTVWPAQFQMKPVQVAAGLVDLKSRVLPACDPRDEGPAVDIGTRAFMSPLVLVAMSHVQGGILGAKTELGEAVAHVAMVFSMDVDPEEVFVAAGFRPSRAVQAVKESVDSTTRRASNTVKDVAGAAAQTGKVATDSVKHTVVAVDNQWGRLERCVESFDKQVENTVGQWLEQPIPSPITEVCKLGAKLPSMPWSQPKKKTGDDRAAKTREEMRQWAMANNNLPIQDPDFDQEGWVSKQGPNGQVQWHHLSMGPPPWEADGSTPSASSTRADSSSPGTTLSPGTAKSGAPNSPALNS